MIVQLAYRPVIIFPDSEYYLAFARDWTVPGTVRVTGYSLFLLPLVHLHRIGVVAAVQHALGLGTAIAVYAALLRLGCRRWLATVATIPVLFDPLQLILEQYLLPDTVAMFFVAVGLTLLVWRRGAIRWWMAALSGLLLAYAGLTRDGMVLVLIPAALYVLFSERGWRRRIRTTAVFSVAGLAPLLAYLGWYHAARGVWGVSEYSDRFLYARVAEFANCSGLSLPSYERPLCPRHPAPKDQNYYMWSLSSPQWKLKPPPGKTAIQVLRDFDHRILEHQPLSLARVSLDDFLYGFSPTRGLGPEHLADWYFMFQPSYPHNLADADNWIFAFGGSPAGVNRPLARFMSDYGVGYVPGPVFAVGLVVGLAGAVGVAGARRSGLRLSCALFAVGALACVAVPDVISAFSWRYQVPQLALLPAAGALGWTAMRSRRLRAGASPDVVEVTEPVTGRTAPVTGRNAPVTGRTAPSAVGPEAATPGAGAGNPSAAAGTPGAAAGNPGTADG